MPLPDFVLPRFNAKAVRRRLHHQRRGTLCIFGRIRSLHLYDGFGSKPAVLIGASYFQSCPRSRRDRSLRVVSEEKIEVGGKRKGAGWSPRDGRRSFEPPVPIDLTQKSAAQHPTAPV
jgi:hypothetical protein